MYKKDYLKPEMKFVGVLQENDMMAGSEQTESKSVFDVESNDNTGIGYGGPGSGSAHSKSWLGEE